jgi:hypothetical protein
MFERSVASTNPVFNSPPEHPDAPNYAVITNECNSDLPSFAVVAAKHVATLLKQSQTFCLALTEIVLFKKGQKYF